MADKINDIDLENVSGGWQYANGPYVNYGSYIVYMVVAGDVLSGIAQRFGVTVAKIKEWNNIKNVDLIHSGDKYIIYPTILR